MAQVQPEARRTIALAVCFGIPMLTLAASYLWLAVHHGTPRLWSVVVHESGRYTLGAGDVRTTLFWYSWTGEEADRDRDEPSRLGFRDGTVLHPPDLLIANLNDMAEPPCTCSLLMRRSVVEAVGGFEESFQRVFTDQAFYAKFFMAAPVYVAETCWDKYRRHEASACAVEATAGHLDARRLQYLEWFSAYLVDRGQARGTLWRAVRRAIWFHHHPRIHRVSREVRALPERAAALFWRTLLPFGLRIARRALPQPLRHWLWTRWRDRNA